MYSFPLFERLKTEAPEFEEVTAFQAGRGGVSVRRQGTEAAPKPLRSEYVTGSYFSTLGVGAFLIQVSVQGAWGIIPVHLNELSPYEIRATFPGVVYQLGNFIASANLNIQVMIAEQHANNYGLAMALVVGSVAVVISVLVAAGPERHGIAMADAHRTPITASI